MFPSIIHFHVLILFAFICIYWFHVYFDSSVFYLYLFILSVFYSLFLCYLYVLIPFVLCLYLLIPFVYLIVSVFICIRWFRLYFDWSSNQNTIGINEYKWIQIQSNIQMESTNTNIIQMESIHTNNIKISYKTLIK